MSKQNSSGCHNYIEDTGTPPLPSLKEKHYESSPEPDDDDETSKNSSTCMDNKKNRRQRRETKILHEVTKC